MFSMLEPNPAFFDAEYNDDASHSQKPPVKPGRRRDKPQMSCTMCRQKKLKCDRMKPCLNCTKRRQPESCDYIKQDSSRGRTAKPQGTTNVQDRVQQLEDMVMALLNSQTIPDQDFPTAEKSSLGHSPIKDSGFTQSTAPSPSITMDPNSPKSSVGKFTGARDQVNFVGSQHWEAILENIAELKIDLETTETSDTLDFRPQILFGVSHASRSEIMSSIPSRSICDMLISRWFRTMDTASMVMHVPTFMKEYEQMFKDPDETPLMWIGLFFSVLGLASHFYAISGEELHAMPKPFTSMREMYSCYRERTAQCLVEVNYLRPRKYTIETLCFYYALEVFQGKDSEFGAYVIVGIIIRVAMRLGYHRDASHYPSISPFDGEMRRRVWSTIFQLDIMSSAQVGLPRMVREEETDTAEPKNLLDTDFDERMTELPHPRPSTDMTPVAYSILKVRLLRQYGIIADQMNCITPPSYDEVMRLDFKLMETHATVPPYLNMRSLSLSVTDDPNIILQRFVLEVCFQKSRCVLHRKHLILGKFNPQFRYSRTASVDAAMKLLIVQCMFNEASQPGGQLSSERWRKVALINPDYVLAAMILCLDFASDRNVVEGMPSDYEDQVETMWPRNKRLQTLKTSYEICYQLSTVSGLAAKATEALRATLKNLDSTDSAEVVQPMSISNTASVSDSTPVSQVPTYSDQAYTAASNKFDFSIPYFIGPSTIDSLAGTMDTEMNFDWELWDSQFQTTPMVVEDFNSLAFQ